MKNPVNKLSSKRIKCRAHSTIKEENFNEKNIKNTVRENCVGKKFIVIVNRLRSVKKKRNGIGCSIRCFKKYFMVERKNKFNQHHQGYNHQTTIVEVCVVICPSCTRGALRERGTI